MKFNWLDLNRLDMAGVGVGLLLCGLVAGNGWLVLAGVLAWLLAMTGGIR